MPAITALQNTSMRRTVLVAIPSLFMAEEEILLYVNFLLVEESHLVSPPIQSFFFRQEVCLTDLMRVDCVSTNGPP